MKHKLPAIGFLVLLALLLIILLFIYLGLTSKQKNLTAIDTAYEFAYALRDHDQSIYEIADPSTWAQIDLWMNTHKYRRCVQEVDEVNVGVTINNEKTDLVISCYLENGSIYFFKIEGIVIEKNRDSGFYVTDWEEVIE
ncbi:MAG: hypothetical protein IT327_06715 [Anaerolineae bacterium]|nr:hypothetical protein [Anaerolineae bacterium]